MSDIDWPTGFERTDSIARERTRKFDSTIGSTTKALEQQMDRMDVDEWRVSTASGGAHVKSNGLPKASANPSDPGFVVRWTKDGKQYAVACDRWVRLKSNAREVLLWIEETRKRGDRPVVTGNAQFAAAQLPSGDEEDAIALDVPPEDVLGVTSEAPDEAIDKAVQAAKREAHPDHGGSRAELQRVLKAEEELTGDA